MDKEKALKRLKILRQAIRDDLDFFNELVENDNKEEYEFLRRRIECLDF
jgi:hypothetical protein